MMPWFLWKGIDSRDMGVWVSELPPPVRPSERSEEVKILGRAGSLILREGDNVHEAYKKECKITAPTEADYATILTWLSGDGEVVFSNEPDRVYQASITGEISFAKAGNSLKVAVVPFFVQPHKGQYPPESDIVLTAADKGTSIYNPGTVASKPLITCTHQGGFQIVVGEKVQRFFDTPAGGIVIDCETEIVRKANGDIWLGQYDTDFLRLEPGANTITWSENTGLNIKPRWRWF